MTADHDRNVGPRGEEEAPRGPAPLTEPSDQSSAERFAESSPETLGYGQLPPEPATRITPVEEPPPPVRRRGLLRRRETQLVGAGLTGLVLGAVVGASVVAGAIDERPVRVERFAPLACVEGGAPCELREWRSFGHPLRIELERGE